MIAIIRISGEVGLRKDVKETLYRLGLRKKYSCIVLNPTKEQQGMIDKIRDFVAFGEINKEVLEDLLEKRGKLIGQKGKIEAKKSLGNLEKGTKLEKLGFRKVFRLHPPRGGIESKKHFGVGKGVLGNNKEKINDLIRRML